MATNRYFDGSGNWTCCKKCGVLYILSENKDNIKCALGGNHETDSHTFIIPYRDPYANGYPFFHCSKCSSLFLKPGSGCPVGGLHKQSEIGTFTIALQLKDLRIRSQEQRKVNSDFKYCSLCSQIFNSKIDGKCSGQKEGRHLESLHWSIFLAEFVDYSSWEKVFLTESVGSSFPAFNSSASEIAGYNKFNEVVSNNSDLRESYASLGQDRISQLPSDIDRVYKNGQPPEGVQKEDWDKIYKQLILEAHALASIDDYFTGLLSIINDVFMQEGWLTNEVLAIFDEEEIINLENGLDFLEFIFGSFGILFNLALVGAGEVISESLKEVINGVVELSETSIKYGLEQGQGPCSDWDVRYALSEKAEKLFNNLSKRYTEFSSTIYSSRNALLSCWVKMEKATHLTSNVNWNDPITRDSLKSNWINGYRIILFQTLFPARFRIMYVDDKIHWVQGTDEQEKKAIIDSINFQYYKTKEDANHAFHYNFDSNSTENKSKSYFISCILKRESQFRGIAFNKLGFAALYTNNYLPSKSFMDKLTMPYNGISINIWALFANYGGWEDTEYSEAEMVPGMMRQV